MSSLSKINYPPALLSWLANVLQIGFLGEIQFVVPAATGTTGYRQELEKWGIPSAHMHTSLVAAEAVMVADRNDVALIWPGDILNAATIDWDKANSHIVGMSGNSKGGFYSPYLYSTDTGIVETLHVEGRSCQFHNFGVANYGDDNACIAGVTLDAEATMWKNVAIQGNINASQATDAGCCSLHIYTNADSCLFDHCYIGSNVNAARTGANSGQVLFDATGAGPGNGKFLGCTFLSHSSTVACAMIAITDDTAIDRLWEFEDCMFNNFSEAYTRPNQVFYTSAMLPNGRIALKNCMAVGYDEWQDADSNKEIQIDMPNAATAGGLGLQPTTSIE